ncbi:helix-hairpin-helix domain-containing protein [Halarsenatibacter silvermanii]|uniref:S1 motif domain-containing protein n=1 Tax=Halarsenatibacter silvermanii TaxID=321763 RepID=A0A1G9QTW8_9FIRM|nr:Tex family protein [Halarsenatibacter silvermanii]SDM14446.1 uncharacterized protein SAMN04488692_11826 [Halarsenatibacter silvermanii]
MRFDLSKSSRRAIAEELELDTDQVKTVMELFNDGRTIPFLARYRREKTGGLDDARLRELKNRLEYAENLEQEKEKVKKKLRDKGKYSKDLAAALDRAETVQEVKDLYAPYRSRRRTRADRAAEQGLTPLAEIIWEQKLTYPELKTRAEKFVNKAGEKIEDAPQALEGAGDILADQIAKDPELKGRARRLFWQQGRIESSLKDVKLDEKGVYEQYYDFSQPAAEVPDFRVLALDRAEEEGILRVKINPPAQKIIKEMEKRIIESGSPLKKLLQDIIADAFKRLMGPSLEREVRSSLTESAHAHAREVFSENLEALLMQRPLPGKIILGIDPAFRTGCKLAVIDGEGHLLNIDVIYPHSPKSRQAEAKEKLKYLADEYEVDIAALGNGTASRETESLLDEFNRENEEELPYTVVSEAGASVYSASKLAAREFPGLDAEQRGAISIARRLQDPLAELVKIDPRSVGVGLYQHDIDSSALLSELEETVEKVVNRVGVNLNTASPSLLAYVSGLNSSQSQSIRDYREKKGSFDRREELLNVKGIGPKTFEESAGFLKIYSEADPLARTSIHPESYETAERLLGELGFQICDLNQREEEVKTRLKEALDREVLNPARIASDMGTGEYTLEQIVADLLAPDRDPRNELPGPEFRTGIRDLKDVEQGDVLRGTVRNVVDFGAFVDVGLKVDGLIHISELAEEYVESPFDIVSTGELVKVKVLQVDRDRERISLKRLSTFERDFR